MALGTRSTRVVGLDVARCLALLGMMATHILPAVQDGQVVLAHQVAGGRASALFAVLAGVSLTLGGSRGRPVHGRAWAAVAAWVAVRAAVIGLVGLFLGELDTGIAVILTYYAVLFCLGIAFLSLDAARLAMVAAAWLVAAPVLSHLLRPALPEPTYASPSLARLAVDPLSLLGELTLTGYYPAIPWLAYLLAGMAVGRLDLRSARVAGLLAVAGAALAALGTVVSDSLLGYGGARAALVTTFEGAGWLGSLDLTLERGLFGTTPTGSWWWLAVAAPHSGTPPDLAATLGYALLAIGACLLLGRLAPRALGVVFGAGTMTLTLYALHVASRQDGWWDGRTVETYYAQAVAVLVVGALYGLAGRKGPLEHLVAALSGAARAGAGGRPADRADRL